MPRVHDNNIKYINIISSCRIRGLQAAGQCHGGTLHALPMLAKDWPDFDSYNSTVRIQSAATVQVPLACLTHRLVPWSDRQTVEWSHSGHVIVYEAYVDSAAHCCSSHTSRLTSPVAVCCCFARRGNYTSLKQFSKLGLAIFSAHNFSV